MQRRKIYAILFDMDGLMFDTETVYLKAWKKTGKKLGIPIDDSFLIPSRGMIRADSRKLFEQLYHPTMDYEAIIEVRQEFLEEEFQKGIICKKGLFELLEYLKQEGYKIGLATSTPEQRARVLLKKANVESFFENMMFGDKVEHGKPAPDIFLQAAEQLGIAPEHCLVLEDSPNGVVAGKKAGCKVIMIPDQVPPSEEVEKLIDAKLEDLEQVIDWLRN